MKSSMHLGDFGFQALFGRASRIIALLVLFFSFFMPVTGLGIDICWLHRWTGLPCPGCGLTRAFASISHGQFAHAWRLNPFIVFFYPLFLAIAISALIGARRRQAILWRLAPFTQWLSKGYQVAIVGFLTFGAGRFVFYLMHGQRFP